MKVSYLKTSLVLVLVLVLLGSLIAQSSAANNATKELCHPNDKRALLRLLQQTNNTITTFGTWDPTTDCCHGWFTVECDSNNRVNLLSLSGSGTEDTHFPTALGDFPYLTHLVYDNNVGGPIPAFLNKLRRHLNTLDLSSNRLSGPIPSFFGSFKSLSELILNDNLLTGIIPPSLGLIPSLALLDLSNNRLSGPIPDGLSNMRSGDVVELSLSNNNLSGEIPRSLDKVPFFTVDLSGNKLEGDPSFLFSKEKTDMAAVDLSHNSFSFDMTNLTITSRIAELILNDNKIFGSLPEALAELPDLNFFNVSDNQLCGHIPRGNLKKFDITSYLHNKCLCGTPFHQCK